AQRKTRRFPVEPLRHQRGLPPGRPPHLVEAWQVINLVVLYLVFEKERLAIGTERGFLILAGGGRDDGRFAAIGGHAIEGGNHVRKGSMPSFRRCGKHDFMPVGTPQWSQGDAALRLRAGISRSARQSGARE